MTKGLYSVEDIKDYMNKITEQQAKSLIKHCNEHEIYPDICAWYENMEDFYSDWCNPKTVNMTREQAREIFDNRKITGEFCRFANGEIVRLVL